VSREPACNVSFPDKLPETIRPVADLVGDGPMLALLEAHGGTRLYIPDRVTNASPLAQLLGLKPAQRLARAYGRDTITIPMCKRWRIELMRQQGLTYAAIGRRLGMHEQSVFSAHSRSRRGTTKAPSDPQLRLQLD
jgi:hypothetical protein